MVFLLKKRKFETIFHNLIHSPNMKNLIIPLIAVIFFSATSEGFSQTKEDYNKTLDFISKAYNENNAASIHEKFSESLKKDLEQVSFQKTIDSLHKDKGQMASYELILEEDGEKSFLVEFDYASMLILIHLTPEGEISLFKITDY